MTSIVIGTMSKAEGETFKAAIQGKTYMYFNVLLCPMPGPSVEVIVQTAHATDLADINGMLLYVMANEIVKDDGRVEELEDRVHALENPPSPEVY